MRYLILLLLLSLSLPAKALTLQGYCSNTKGVIGVVASHHVIGQIIPGSPAEAAGLRKGDKILNYSAIEGDALTFSHLIVRRGSVKFEVDVLRLPEGDVYGHKADKTTVRDMD